MQTRFAVIGDYGVANQAELDVSNLVKSWKPDFVITTGDNNYPSGSAESIDRNIGQYYREFIYPYTGSYGAGRQGSNAFFPSLGNHDWEAPGAAPYLSYFTLPGNERYYDFVRGNVHLFAIDSDPGEPDGITSTSTQATWLRVRLAASGSLWKLVYMHHPPYSSGPHGNTVNLQWPFAAWGATAVLAGHDHDYERIIKSGFPYFVCGLGGNGIYGFVTTVPGSVVRYTADYGAMLVEAGRDSIVFRFFSRGGTMIDRYSILSAHLPIELSSFAATLSSDSSEVELHWTTLSETNNYGFNVQHRARADDEFVDLPNGFVEGQGTTLTSHTYTWRHRGVTQGTNYYRLRIVALDGTSHYSDATVATVPALTWARPNHPSGAHQEVLLSRNYPNPFNSTVTIQYTLLRLSDITLKVFNILSEEIADLGGGEQSAGDHVVRWNADRFPSGVYVLRLQVNKQSFVQKLLLMK